MQCKTLILLVVPLMVSGCLSQSQIQSKYMRSQNDCRSESAYAAASGQPMAPTADGQSPIAAKFSDCMNKAGWHLATAKPVVVTTNPPTGSPSTNPSAALRPAGPVAQNNPPSGSPSVAPSAAATRVAAPPAQQEIPTTLGMPSYQPARPASVATPAYGAGPGRQF